MGNGTVHAESSKGGAGIWDLTLGNVINTNDLSKWEAGPVDRSGAPYTTTDGVPLADAAKDLVGSHSKGHSMQSSRLGPLFLPGVGLPSLATSSFSFHYKMPWEAGADRLGAKYSARHAPGARMSGYVNIGGDLPMIPGSERPSSTP